MSNKVNNELLNIGLKSVGKQMQIFDTGLSDLRKIYEYIRLCNNDAVLVETITFFNTFIAQQVSDLLKESSRFNEDYSSFLNKNNQGEENV